jgi:hypothetical protein
MLVSAFSGGKTVWKELSEHSPQKRHSTPHFSDVSFQAKNGPSIFNQIGIGRRNKISLLRPQQNKLTVQSG